MKSFLQDCQAAANEGTSEGCVGSQSMLPQVRCWWWYIPAAACTARCTGPALSRPAEACRLWPKTLPAAGPPLRATSSRPPGPPLCGARSPWGTSHLLSLEASGNQQTLAHRRCFILQVQVQCPRKAGPGDMSRHWRTLCREPWI